MSKKSDSQNSYDEEYKKNVKSKKGKNSHPFILNSNVKLNSSGDSIYSSQSYNTSDSSISSFSNDENFPLFYENQTIQIKNGEFYKTSGTKSVNDCDFSAQTLATNNCNLSSLEMSHGMLSSNIDNIKTSMYKYNTHHHKTFNNISYNKSSINLNQAPLSSISNSTSVSASPVNAVHKPLLYSCPDVTNIPPTFCTLSSAICSHTLDNTFLSQKITPSIASFEVKPLKSEKDISPSHIIMIDEDEYNSHNGTNMQTTSPIKSYLVNQSQNTCSKEAEENMPSTSYNEFFTDDAAQQRQYEYYKKTDRPYQPSTSIDETRNLLSDQTDTASIQNNNVNVTSSENISTASEQILTPNSTDASSINTNNSSSTKLDLNHMLGKHFSGFNLPASCNGPVQATHEPADNNNNNNETNLPNGVKKSTVRIHNQPQHTNQDRDSNASTIPYLSNLQFDLKPSTHNEIANYKSTNNNNNNKGNVRKNKLGKKKGLQSNKTVDPDECIPFEFDFRANVVFATEEKRQEFLDNVNSGANPSDLLQSENISSSIQYKRLIESSDNDGPELPSIHNDEETHANLERNRILDTTDRRNYATFNGRTYSNNSLYYNNSNNNEEFNHTHIPLLEKSTFKKTFAKNEENNTLPLSNGGLFSKKKSKNRDNESSQQTLHEPRTHEIKTYSTSNYNPSITKIRKGNPSKKTKTKGIIKSYTVQGNEREWDLNKLLNFIEGPAHNNNNNAAHAHNAHSATYHTNLQPNSTVKSTNSHIGQHQNASNSTKNSRNANNKLKNCASSDDTSTASSTNNSDHPENEENVLDNSSPTTSRKTNRSASLTRRHGPDHLASSPSHSTSTIKKHFSSEDLSLMECSQPSTENGHESGSPNFSDSKCEGSTSVRSDEGYSTPPQEFYDNKFQVVTKKQKNRPSINSINNNPTINITNNAPNIAWNQAPFNHNNNNVNNSNNRPCNNPKSGVNNNISNSRNVSGGPVNELVRKISLPKALNMAQNNVNYLTEANEPTSSRRIDSKDSEHSLKNHDSNNNTINRTTNVAVSSNMVKPMNAIKNNNNSNINNINNNNKFARQIRPPPVSTVSIDANINTNNKKAEQTSSFMNSDRDFPQLNPLGSSNIPLKVPLQSAQNTTTKSKPPSKNNSQNVFSSTLETPISDPKMANKPNLVSRAQNNKAASNFSYASAVTNITLNDVNLNDTNTIHNNSNNNINNRRLPFSTKPQIKSSTNTFTNTNNNNNEVPTYQTSPSEPVIFEYANPSVKSPIPNDQTRGKTNTQKLQNKSTYTNIKDPSTLSEDSNNNFVFGFDLDDSTLADIMKEGPDVLGSNSFPLNLNSGINSFGSNGIFLPSCNPNIPNNITNGNLNSNTQVFTSSDNVITFLQPTGYFESQSLYQKEYIDGTDARDFEFGQDVSDQETLNDADTSSEIGTLIEYYLKIWADIERKLINQKSSETNMVS